MPRKRKQPEQPEPQALPDTLNEFTLELIDDLRALRRGDITLREGRVRALLAREVLRSVHLHLEGMKLLSDQSRPVGGKVIGSD